jgi:hypothetical protein
LEFLLNGAPQGLISLVQPLASDVIYCVGVCHGGHIYLNDPPPTPAPPIPTPASPTPPPPPPNLATSVLLTEAAESKGARCLDGSPQRFWLQDAPQGSVNASKWIFRFMGGGWCGSLKACAGSYFGSSNESCFNSNTGLDCYVGKNFSEQMDFRDIPCIDGARWGGGLLMGEPKTNPLAHDWNKAEMAYEWDVPFTQGTFYPIEVADTLLKSPGAALFR